MPIVLLPIKFSSIFLLILSLITILNVALLKNKKTISKSLIYPFIAFYASIFISFIIDFYFGFFQLDFLLRNIIVLIIPLYIFTSNFTRNQIYKILKGSSVIVSIIGLIIIVNWVVGYQSYFAQQEFLKNEWFKNQVIIDKEYVKNDSLFKITIPPSSSIPSLRKIGVISKVNENDTLIRELNIKVKPCKQNIWVLLRKIDDKKSKGAWFNLKNGQIGFAHEGMIANSKVLKDGYYCFSLKNKLTEGTSKEWFYISFVSGNKLYRWESNSTQEYVDVILKTPKFYTSLGDNLLKTKSIFNHKLTNFSFLDSYAHGTYMALIFLFALTVLIFNSFLSKWVRYLFIILNILVVFLLASKAVIISLILLLAIYFFKRKYSYKFMAFFFLIVIFVGFNSYVKDRFVDMYHTIIKFDDNKALGELDNLSTNTRIKIYKDYYHLIKENYLVGYGNVNGKHIFNDKFKYDFNTHNQYLQNLFNSGAIGFLLLVFFCVSPLILNKFSFHDETGLLFFILIMLFNFLFESIMYRQWGLVMVSFSFAMYFQFLKSRWSQ
ncbi:MAG: hypothetical protein COW44_02515 [Flavobacteriaceae bacterium CG17_big_fil_post_rev_8_21_14_2_50_33_15]|nr:MAG: hypothetical protein COW44_02515 [Flavobacteriaceae bacterium CG17_big_fil_post_rev_8_21_14_2_50_33_15]PJB18795.1 MAG: hypothetical protein CO117_07080 [Flavobacteriaceae bacterium CG_4_9_14_3_um_filter_33_16]